MSNEGPKGERSAHRANSLDGLYLSFANRLLEALRRWVESRPAAQYLEPIVEVTGAQFRTHYSMTYSYWGTVSSHLSEIEDWPETEECARQHLAAGILRPPQLEDLHGQAIVAPEFEQIRKYLTDALLKPILRWLAEHGRSTCTPEDLRDCYERAVREWTRTTNLWMLAAPVIRLEGDFESISLGPFLKLRTFPDDLKSHILSVKTGFGPPASEIITTRFCIAAEFEQDIQRGNAIPRHIRDDIKSVVRALRLIKTGSVGCPTIFLCRKVDEEGFGGLHSTPGPASRSARRYLFSKDDVPALQSIFETLRRGQKEQWLRSLEVALNRFDYAYDRTHFEDRIIDLTIALENTLLHDVNEELKYRLSLRAAALLRNRIDPTWTKEFLVTLYEARSRIVHRGQAVNEIQDLKKLPTAPDIVGDSRPDRIAENLVRLILREYLAILQRTKSLREIGRELDAVILEGISEHQSK